MEFKTCEQYVLAELESTKNELELLKDAHKGLLDQYIGLSNSYEELLLIVRKLARLNHSENSYDYISFNFLWDSDEEFEKFIEVVKPEIIRG